ncbi:MAG: diguanylate cyclase [Acidobacteria bacterium]|nr:diguanylate cyclase [Acidobacteriota bacterium]
MNARRATRVLVIDDDTDVLGLLRALCHGAGVEILEAVDAQAGLALAREHAPDLVLLDLVLPDRDGLDVLGEMRGDSRLAHVPVVVLSARRTQATKVAAFEAGADDYIVKPFGLQEIDARIRANLRKRELYRKLERANWELRLANERLAELAQTDELTGLANARTLRDRLKDEFLRAERYETPLSVVMADLDGFKATNDRHGHPAGDRILAQLAQRLRAAARATDLVARYGGDEFAFVLPHTGLADATSFAQRLCAHVLEVPLRLGNGSAAGVRLSCGVATWPDSGPMETAEEMLETADQALYAAKRDGGGGVVAAHIESSTPCSPVAACDAPTGATK